MYLSFFIATRGLTFKSPSTFASKGLFFMNVISIFLSRWLQSPSFNPLRYSSTLVGTNDIKLTTSTYILKFMVRKTV